MIYAQLLIEFQYMNEYVNQEWRMKWWWVLLLTKLLETNCITIKMDKNSLKRSALHFMRVLLIIALLEVNI